MMIYLSRPYIDHREIESVAKVLRSGWLSGGKMTYEFERKFADFIGVKYAVSLNSCASALQLAIKGLNLKGEIIVPSFTFVASVNSIINSGCVPRFIDIEYNSCNMDVRLIKGLINKKTVAIMPVHFAGQSCNMEKIVMLARASGLAVIEDSAEAIGAMFKRKMAGSSGVGCFSFFSTKNITCGEGGMLTTDNRILRDTVAALSSHGIRKITAPGNKKPWHRESRYVGFNYRMPNILAAVGKEQLNKIAYLNEARRKIANYYNESLADCGEMDLPREQEYCRHVYQMYTVKLKLNRAQRDNFIGCLRKKGIEASAHFYPPLHKQKLYRGYLRPGDKLPVTETVSERIVTLPLYPGLSGKQLAYTVKSVKDALRLILKVK